MEMDRKGRRLLDARQGVAAELPIAVLLQTARALRPGVRLQSAALLASEDNYYYSHHQERVFPVLRVQFASSDGATFYIDPRRGQLAGYADSNSKWNRWLFSGLHQLDFIRHRPAWDVLLVALCLLGTMLAVTGIRLGWKRLRSRPGAKFRGRNEDRISSV
jgi:uncharacterized iron-regulated membrane protein